MVLKLDKCDLKGFYGLNSYCILKDQEAECIYLTGFTFIIEGNWTSGCKRDYAVESYKGDIAINRMQEIPNTIWEDNTCSVLSLLSKEDC